MILMILARITGQVVSSHKNRHLDRHKLLLAHPIDLDGNLTGSDPIVAIDRAQAGPGDTVLVNDEGGGARIVLHDEKSPVRAMIVAVVDDFEFEAPAASAEVERNREMKP